MTEKDLLAERFEANRPQLRAVAYRMLGSSAEADDAVQEAWLRLSRTDTTEVDNLGAWLTTVVGRICLDMLRSRGSRREEPFDARTVEPVATSDQADPEREAMLADSVGLALLVVLETLTPAERLAFVLHDLFAVSYDEIAPIVGRSPAASRQLASRARRRVQADAATPEADLPRQRGIVDAFLTAARGGEVSTLLTLLDPDVVIRPDGVAARLAGRAQLRGAQSVADFFAGRAGGARTAVVDGAPGAVVVLHGQLRLALSFIVREGRIIGIDVVADPEQLCELDITTTGSESGGADR
ncbi:sigma-70 family RNA polymerase sigma factor [Plantactinospora sp. KLBMP9567]|uniref:sigma-70 family RNA polymerase sigma factor n=1 Tax=Plantactinospora sp. KLBMP9567 TaxID=3085900 RepID=UPI002980FDF2|nr:sigma-70 family RNA polymerase sigma factor [Plantactinospora sp. KLBMP9567]MDW5325216.1 sigma-70 family RNA polymerase sigma factor [Plantactinospora sp. KLBMP9567]